MHTHTHTHKSIRAELIHRELHCNRANLNYKHRLHQDLEQHDQPIYICMRKAAEPTNLHTEKVSGLGNHTHAHTHIKHTKWHLLCGQRLCSQYRVRVPLSTGFVMQIISARGKILRWIFPAGIPRPRAVLSLRSPTLSLFKPVYPASQPASQGSESPLSALHGGEMKQGKKR